MRLRRPRAGRPCRARWELCASPGFLAVSDSPFPIPDDAGADLELPQLLARARVHRLEPAVERAIEDDTARRRERATPHGEGFLDAPDFSSRRRVPRDELAAVSARALLLRRIRADVWRSRDVAHGPHLEVHAQVVRRDVEQPGARRERGGLVVLAALEARANVLHELSFGRHLLRNDLWSPRLHVDARRPVHLHEW